MGLTCINSKDRMDEDAETLTGQVYDYVWHWTASGQSLHVA